MTAEGITKAFGGNVVLQDVQLRLFAGDVVLLRGENGSGKTTLLNILTGNLEPDRGSLSMLADGSPAHFTFPRHSWQRFNPRDHFSPDIVAREQIGRSWQDLRLFPSLSVAENLNVAAIRNWGEDPVSTLLPWTGIAEQERDITRRTLELLRRFGLEDHAASPVSALSLGDAKRTAVARAVQARARVLFLDEPLSGLDEDGVVRIIELLRQLAASHEVTLVIVEHSFHIPRLMDLVTRVWTLRNGVLAEETPDEVRLELPGLERDSVANWALRLERDGWSERHEALSRGGFLTVLAPPNRQPAPVVLQLQDWTVRRNGQLVVGKADRSGAVGGLELTLRSGEIGILRAPNGWGKTTLAESMLGLLPNDGGSAFHRGSPIQSLQTWERAQRGILLLRSRENVFPTMRADEMLRLAGATSHFDMAGSLKRRSIHQLSGGERQRVALTAYLGRPDASLLILDEPFNTLDSAGVAALQKHLEGRSDLATLILVPGSDAIDKGVTLQ